MSAGERNWDDDSAASGTASGPSQETFGNRRLAVAAMVALAVVAGALGGALATAGLSHLVGGEVASADSHALDAAIARIDADIQALKAGVEHSSKLAVSQYNKTSERLDKVEKAQAEPAAKLAKLSETVDKLRTPPTAAAPAPVAATPAGAKEVTGSIAPPATAAPVPLPAPKPEVGAVADPGRLGAARRRQWRRADRRPARNIRGLCRRSRARSRPHRRHPPPGRPLGGRDQQGPDRRPLKSFASPRRDAIARCLRLVPRQRVRISASFPEIETPPATGFESRELE